MTGNQYTWHYDGELHVTATGNPFAVTLDVEVARDSLSTGGSWTERGVTLYSITANAGSSADQTWTDEQKSHTITSTDMSDTGNNTRLRIKSATISSLGPVSSTEGTYSFHGYNVAVDGDSNHGITWQTQTNITASMTPSTDRDAITWEAFEAY